MDDLLRLGALASRIAQADAALRDLAKIFAHYRQELVDGGMPADDALEMCLDLQRRVILGDLADEPIDPGNFDPS